MYSQYVLLKTNSYIIRMSREDNLCWFHGKVSRDRAEQILREEGLGDGVFLVRDSNSSGGDYVLSVLHKGDVWHYQIRRHGEDAFFSIDDQTPIHGLDSLIEHYQKGANGLVTQLSAIVKRDPPPHDSRSSGRTNLLHRATKEGDFTVVSELLKCGYRNIDAKNQDGQTAVHLACRFGNDRMVKKLIESGANVNCRDSDGNTPLHYACRQQSTAMVRMLVDAQANIQARNNGTGCVPLHDAARHGNLEVVKTLLELGAPHMPRSTFGELPADYANEGNHRNVVAFLEKYHPPPSTLYRFQWYHGTLDRLESNNILLQYADKTTKEAAASTNKSNGNDVETDKNQMSNLTSGVFLVRFSEKNGDDILTLLFDNQPKHFIIQKYHKHLYIDEGPYMESLEHLVQHYMKFSDGLPINLRYGVPPKPKPPLPLPMNKVRTQVSPKPPINFTTMPRNFKTKSPIKSPVRDNPLLSPTKQSTANGNNVQADDEQSRQQFAKKSTQRNLSIPTDDLMNTVGLLENNSSITKPTSDSSHKSKSKDFIFRSLKLPSKKKHIDGASTIGKTKGSKKEEILKNSQTDDSSLEFTSSLRNLTFTTDIYNIPQNNSAVVFTTMAEINSPAQEDVQNQNVVVSTTSIQPSPTSIYGAAGSEHRDYFTESDDKMFSTDIATEQGNKCVEEIYFIDAPTIVKSDLPITSFTYVPFTDMPFFPDLNSTTTTVDNNNVENVAQQKERNAVVSIVSVTDSEFMLQHQVSNDSTNCQSPGIVAKPNYFIPKSHLQLNEILGEGEFGSVYSGTLKYTKSGNGSSEELPVAIKTLHDEHCKQNRQEFLREASVMLKLSHHCIVKLIGISKGPPLRMIQELVELGSMLNYLIVHSNQINVNFELKIWASQIACGMSFLESHHFVHRDLAARNILLASKHQAKISDFGLSRALCAGNNYYQASQGGKWPIKWYAPESFNYGTFSHASDVWSFGVTLWEMFSYGHPPYGDMKGVDVIKLVEQGKRLPKPNLCPNNVFHIMETCWNYNPKDRPSFQYLTQFFANDPDYQNLVELIKTEDIS